MSEQKPARPIEILLVEDDNSDAELFREQRLLQSEQFLRSTLNALSSSIAILDEKV